MKSKIIFALTLLALIGSVQATEIDITLPFPTDMTAGDSYTSVIKVRNEANEVKPLMLYFKITKPEIAFNEFLFSAIIGNTELDCLEINPGEWECWDGSSHYQLQPGRQEFLNITLSIHPAALPGTFDYLFQLKGAEIKEPTKSSDGGGGGTFVWPKKNETINETEPINETIIGEGNATINNQTEGSKPEKPEPQGFDVLHWIFLFLIMVLVVTLSVTVYEYERVKNGKKTKS